MWIYFRGWKITIGLAFFFNENETKVISITRQRLPRWLSDLKSTFQYRRCGFDPGLGRYPGEEKGYPLQYSGLENSMDSIVHGVAKSWTQLSDFHFHYKTDLNYEAALQPGPQEQLIILFISSTNIYWSHSSGKWLKKGSIMQTTEITDRFSVSLSNRNRINLSDKCWD